MRLTVERSALLSAMSRIAAIVDRSISVEVLGNVLIEADGVLRLRSSNLNMEAMETVAANIDEPGSITAPAAMLLDIVKAADDGADISLSWKQGDPRLKVQSGRARHSIGVWPAADFPGLMTEDAQGFDIKGDDLARLLDAVSFAASTDASRMYLQGVHLTCGGDALFAAATDGRFRAESQTKAICGAIETTVPTKAVQEIVRLTAGVEDMVSVAITESKIIVRCGEASIASKVLADPFPKIPPMPDDAQVVRFDRADMTAMLRRTLIASDDKDTSGRLTITEDSITASSKGQKADCGDEIRCDSEISAEFGVSMSRTQTIMSRLKGDIVELRVSATSPILRWSAPCDPDTFVVSGKLVV